jgi:16S rRNA (adenine1518-N6/adenine1519-N6)-dimethyltransferase
MSKHFGKVIEAKKKWGQHFLVNVTYRDKLSKTIQDVALQYPDIPFVEIGPGSGSLTEMLIETDKKIYAFDIDQQSVDYIREHYPQVNCELFDAKDIAHLPVHPNFIFTGNLPYNVGSRMLVDLGVYYPHNPVIAMVQKEVAHKLRLKSMNMFGAWQNIWWNWKIAFTLPPHAYQPQPRVHSAVIVGSATDMCLEYNTEERKQLLKLLKTLMQFPSKSLKNNLKTFLSEDDIVSLYALHSWTEGLRLQPDNYCFILFEIYRYIYKHSITI